jgi:three-Cys-motif partner protein
MELAWATLESLADHKRGYRRADSPKPEYKVELWMLFPSAGIMRTLALEAAKLRESDMIRATRLFGTEDWRPIYELRRLNELSGADAREEYVNLMRWRLERSLGYRYTHPFELRNLRGGPMYHMIFATDNDAGTRIMTSIYRNAAATMPEMQREAQGRRHGQQSFDFDVEVAGAQPGYEYEPPWQPPSADDVVD